MDWFLYENGFCHERVKIEWERTFLSKNNHDSLLMRTTGMENN